MNYRVTLEGKGQTVGATIFKEAHPVDWNRLMKRLVVVIDEENKWSARGKKR